MDARGQPYGPKHFSFFHKDLIIIIVTGIVGTSIASIISKDNSIITFSIIFPLV